MGIGVLSQGLTGRRVASKTISNRAARLRITTAIPLLLWVLWDKFYLNLF